MRLIAVSIVSTSLGGLQNSGYLCRCTLDFDLSSDLSAWPPHSSKGSQPGSPEEVLKGQDVPWTQSRDDTQSQILNLGLITQD